MTALKHSIVRDTPLKPQEEVLKKFRVKHLHEVFPPIGHIYSVMIETLEVKNPDFSKFLEKLNEYIDSGGDPLEIFKNQRELLCSITAQHFKRYLKEEWPGITEKQFKKITIEAYGGCNHQKNSLF